LHIYRVVVIKKSQKEIIVNENTTDQSVVGKKLINSNLAGWDVSLAN